MSVRVLKSPATKRNSEVQEIVKDPGESNLTWLGRVFAGPVKPKGADESLLVLLGGNDPLSFRLRIAQSHVRHDLSPSAWSHVAFVMSLDQQLEQSPILEVSLSPREGFGPFGHPASSNGIQESLLAEYDSSERFPNIALLALPVAHAKVKAKLDDLKFQRGALDCPQLILKWLAYCWGVGVPASPLAEGAGVPAAAVLEVAFAANGFDLTPGLESRSSCPEAIWQAAAWWQDFYMKAAGKKAIRGAYSAKHDLIPEHNHAPPHRPAAPPAGGKPDRARAKPERPPSKRRRGS